MQIDQSVFIVTGGASGLGAATARMLSGAGARVVIADVNAAAGEALATELGAGARFIACNIADETSASTVVDQTHSVFGSLHGLVNCAGIVHAEKTVGREGAHALDAFRRVIDVNLVGTFNMARLAAEAMAKNAPNANGERGVIVNTASVAAFDGQMGQVAYAASKAGIAGMTLPLARDLARSGIRVMAVAPGIFETPMMAGMPAEVRDALGATVPFPPRMGRPEEFALLVRQIVENPYLNGEVIRLDGAIRMPPK